MKRFSISHRCEWIVRDVQIDRADLLINFKPLSRIYGGYEEVVRALGARLTKSDGIHHNDCFNNDFDEMYIFIYHECLANHKYEIERKRNVIGLQ